uniref:Uncharacterized protein n=1 Tax=Panagrolaimus superbus TaxID=310955 RepID=A0A914YKB4_9BILA
MDSQNASSSSTPSTSSELTINKDVDGRVFSFIKTKSLTIQNVISHVGFVPEDADKLGVMKYEAPTIDAEYTNVANAIGYITVRALIKMNKNNLYLYRKLQNVSKANDDEDDKQGSPKIPRLDEENNVGNGEKPRPVFRKVSHGKYERRFTDKYGKTVWNAVNNSDPEDRALLKEFLKR